MEEVSMIWIARFIVVELIFLTSFYYLIVNAPELPWHD